MREVEERVKIETFIERERAITDQWRARLSRQTEGLSSLSARVFLPPSGLIGVTLLAGLFFLIGCGSTPSASPSPNTGTETESEENRPTTDTLPDREQAISAIERAGGVPCGLSDTTQRAALPAERWRVASGETLVQLECAFFGLQGVYEYWLLSEGAARALGFSDSEPLQIPIPGRPAPERRSPASRERSRDMLCGRPNYEAESEQLESACLGQGGRCGAYSRYRLDRENLRFEVQERRMQPCAAMSELPPAEWPMLR